MCVCVCAVSFNFSVKLFDRILKPSTAVLNAARVTFRHLTAGLGMSRMSGLPKASADEDDKRFQQCPRYGTKHTDPK